MSEVMRFIARLENELQGLILEWERFFAGDRRVPPQRERDQLRRSIRSAVERKQPRGATWFRLEQLQHRFATYDELWRRQLREREEGRGGAPPPRFARRSVPPAQHNVASTNTADDRSVHSGDDDSLYERWCVAKQQHGGHTTLTRQEFQAKLEQQKRRVERRLGKPVRFDVVIRDGRVRLGARPTDTQDGE